MASTLFYTLPIKRVWNETHDSVAISFDVPAELHDVFQYKHGQYITIKTEMYGTSERRAYSLCSSPFLDEPLTIAVKKVSDGRVSKWLNEQIHQGAHVEVMPPMGNFTTALSSNNTRHLLCIAGGSGITPILSIIKSALFVEQQSVVTLVYANMNEATTMFAAELDNMQKQYQHRLRVVHVREEDQQGTAFFVGRLSHDGFQNILSNYAPDLSSVDAFLCGPEGLMNIARTGLLEAGLPMQRIHQEYFSISSTSEAATTMSDSTTEIVTRRVKIRLYGQDHEFDVHPDETILSAAQRADLDPPYACQIGACCTCRAKLVSGSASMDEREALSDDEIADGYILTCQAHPTSDGCFADYDQ